MKFSFKLLEKIKDQAGVTAVIIAICLTMLIGFTALAVDVGYMYATKNELQNVADASALAATRKLGTIYQGMTEEEQQAYVCGSGNSDITVIKGVANAVAHNNKAGGKHIIVYGMTEEGIDIDEVEIGVWDPYNIPPPSEDFTDYNQPDAVRVKARMDGATNSPITTFFAKIFGIDTVDVSAYATAALTGPVTVDEGELKTPFGISERMFPSNCTDVIEFSPTRDSCVGWHNFFDAINAARMKEKLLGFIVGDGQGVDEDGDGISDDCLRSPCGEQWLLDNFDHLLPDPLPDDPFPDGVTTPEVGAGDSFEFQGGAIASLFNGWYLTKDDDVNIEADIFAGTFDAPATILALFDYFRYRDDDGNNAVWTATIPVYKEEGDSCSNPNSSLAIVGFAEIEVLQIGPPDDDPLLDKLVKVSINCDMSFLPGRGGGGGFGTLKGTIPNLVE